MWPHTRSFTIGVIGSIATLWLSTIALARTSAFAMPGTMPTMVWEWVVIFGLGATLVALVIQFAAIALFKVAAWPALAGFITSAAVILLVSGLLPPGFKTLIAWTIGALLASLLARVTSNHSSKPSPLREPA